MREIIRNARRVVHVAVREQNMVYWNNLVRGLSDVKAHIQLRDSDHGLFGRDRIADDLQLVYLYPG
jgi:hypothetical protein